MSSTGEGRVLIARVWCLGLERELLYFAEIIAVETGESEEEDEEVRKVGDEVQTGCSDGAFMIEVPQI